MLEVPFPFPGKKKTIASRIWQAIGADVANYVEPFAGSCAVLLARPLPGKVETVNDASGLVANVWRAIKLDPHGVAVAADQPVVELDLRAWQAELIDAAEGLADLLESNPRAFDAELAGRWIWGACCQIGGRWCDPAEARARKLPHLSGGGGVGVGYGRGVHARHGRAHGDLFAWFDALSTRLRTVRITCGDFERILSPAVTTAHGPTGVLLDPEYDPEMCRPMYPTKAGVNVERTASARARRWAIDHGDNPDFRIVLCGLAGEHKMPDGWLEVAWKAPTGYAGTTKSDADRPVGREEVLHLSPHCFGARQLDLLSRASEADEQPSPGATS